MANVSLLRWKEYGDTDAPSLRERFEPGPYPGQEKIVRYLENGKVILAAPGISRDVFTGELIAVRLEVLTDGAYSWDTALSYYVKKYNLRLPGEFEDKVLAEYPDRHTGQDV